VQCEMSFSGGFQYCIRIAASNGDNKENLRDIGCSLLPWNPANNQVLQINQHHRSLMTPYNTHNSYRHCKIDMFIERRCQLILAGSNPH
jgi:hypothetical protein